MQEKKPALPPGSLVYVGEEQKHEVEITGAIYSAEEFKPFRVKKVADLPEPGPTEKIWINVTGIHEINIISDLGDKFQLPPLVLEDVLNTGHRAKLEDWDQLVFIILKMLYVRDEQIAYEAVSLIMGDNWVLTFQEQPKDVFEPVRERLKQQGRRIREAGSDYLTYTLIDAIIDNYLVVMDHVEDQIASLKTDILQGKNAEIVQRLQSMQSELIFLGKTFRSGREVLGQILRKEIQRFSPTTCTYLGDASDHAIKSVESVDIQSELLASLDTLYFNLLNQRTNETMKILTLYASIFLPLTFLAGIYGMNFEFMPELSWKYSYPVLLLIMVIIATALLTYFRKNKWL